MIQNFTFADSPRSALSQSYGSNCEASCVVSCPPHWERKGTRCYYWSTERKNWYKAEEHCVSIGGHLASVPNEQVHTYMQEKKAYERWIGGVREPGNETWVWTDCSPWTYDSGWHYRRPGASDRRNCMEYYYSDNKWAYFSCTIRDYFICSTSICPGRLIPSLKIYIFFHFQENLLHLKRLFVPLLNAQRTVLLVGRSLMAGATSGTRRSCSGKKRRRGAKASEVTWHLLLPKIHMTTYAYM